MLPIPIFTAFLLARIVGASPIAGEEQVVLKPHYPRTEHIQVGGMTIGQKHIPFEHYQNGTIQTDEFFIYTSPDNANKINSAIGVNDVNGLSIVDCSTLESLPRINVELKGRDSITLSGHEYVIQAGGNCISAFVPLQWPDREPRWYIGQTYAYHYDLFGSRPHMASPVPPTLHVGVQEPPEIERLELREVELGTQRFNPKHTIAIIPRGSMAMFFPERVAAAFNAEIGAKQIVRHGVQAVDCSTVFSLPDLNFYFFHDGVDVVVQLKAASYIIHAGRNCFAPFIGLKMPRGNPWLIGGMFMQQYRLF